MMSRTENFARLRLAVMLLVFMILAPVATAATRQDTGNWDNLKALAPGDNIRVVLNDKKSHQGKFRSATDNTIVVLLLKGEQTFDRGNIQSVSTKVKSHRGRNALLGAAMGGAIMLGISAAQSERVYTLVFGIPAGVAAGAIGGWFIPTGRWRKVYRAQ